MITLTDMQKAFEIARERRNEQQIKLRKAAHELVQTYRVSLQSATEQSVETGEVVDGTYYQKPVMGIELGPGNALHFVITTVLENRVVSKFVITASIALREHDKNLSVMIEGESLPVLVVGEEVEGRFYEAAERIKGVVLSKIERLA